MKTIFPLGYSSIIPRVVFVVAAIIINASAAEPEVSTRIYIQKVIDDATGRNLQLISVGVHACPPGASQFVVVAHTSRKAIGHKSDEREDRAAIQHHKIGGPNLLEGHIYDVTVPFDDASGRPIGALAIHVKPAASAGDPVAEARALALKFGKELSGFVPSNAAMFEKTE